MGGLRRLVVIGVTGAAKTTFARELAARLGYAHVEMDAIYWLPNWTAMPTAQFRERIAEALSGDCWIVDGNYSIVRDIIWSRADTVIWLDYPPTLILWRLIWRTVRRIATREALWNGNQERLRDQLSRDSLILWALQSYRKHRKTYPALFQQPEYVYLNVVRLRSPGAARQWLEAL